MSATTPDAAGAAADLLPRKFVFAEADVTIAAGPPLGKGSFGEVRRGTAKGLSVCVKVCVPFLLGLSSPALTHQQTHSDSFASRRKTFAVESHSVCCYAR